MAVNFVIVCELPTREMPSTALLFFCFKIFPMNSSTLLLRFNQIELSSFTCFVFLFLLIFRRTQFPKWAQKNRVMEQMQFLCDRSIFSLQNIQKRKLWIEYISNMFPHSHRSWRSLLSYPIKYNTVSIPKHHVGVVIIKKNSRQNLVWNNYSAKIRIFTRVRSILWFGKNTKNAITRFMNLWSLSNESNIHPELRPKDGLWLASRSVKWKSVA